MHIKFYSVNRSVKHDLGELKSSGGKITGNKSC
jgi:hypothetical protein